MLTTWNVSPLVCFSFCAVTRADSVVVDTSMGVEVGPSQVPDSLSSVGEEVDCAESLATPIP